MEHTVGSFLELTFTTQTQRYFVRAFVFIQGHLGASGSFAVVRQGNDESLIESRPQRSDVPDLTQVQNSIHFFLLYEYLQLSLLVLPFIQNMSSEDIGTVCAQLISQPSNNSGLGCGVTQGHHLQQCQKPICFREESRARVTLTTQLLD